MSDFDNSNNLVGRQVLFIDAPILYCTKPEDMKIGDLTKTGVHLFQDQQHAVVGISDSSNAIFVHLNFAEAMEFASVLSMVARVLLNQEPIL